MFCMNIRNQPAPAPHTSELVPKRIAEVPSLLIVFVSGRGLSGGGLAGTPLGGDREATVGEELWAVLFIF